MAAMRAVVVLALCLACRGAHQSSEVNPVQKVVQLLGDLKAKVEKDGKNEDASYAEFETWCRQSAQDCGFRIKTSSKEKAELEASVSKCSADGDLAATSISKLAADISKAEVHLENATTIRKTENTNFLATEDELMEAIDMLGRAVKVLQREMAKNPALLQQTANSKNVQSLVQSVSAVIDAASFGQNDHQKLLALVQSQAGEQDEEEDDAAELGAPSASAYKTKSGSIVEVLADMKEKAEEQLAAVRKTETEALHAYQLLKQSLKDQMKAFGKELEETKSDKSKAAECVAKSQESLVTTTGALTQAKKELATIQNDCSVAKKDHEVSLASRAEEIGAIDKATEVITSQTGGAEEETYSFVQTRSSSKSTSGSSASLVELKVLNKVKKLAEQYKSMALTQLVSKIGSVLRFGSGDDPFKKVKGLISDLIERLQKEATAEAEHKAYCDKEMKDTTEKKESLSDDIDDVTGKIDQAVATTTKLKEQVAEAQQELAELVKRQAEMDQARKDEKAAFLDAKKDLTEGLSAIGKAIRVLREYYEGGDEDASFMQDGQVPPAPELSTHSKASGAGRSIISMLELISSDFSKNLSEETITEEEAQSQYDKMTQENKITKAMLEQDIKYKTQSSKALDKDIADYTSDKEGLSNELSAVLEYWDKLVAQCVAKPETYEERMKRRAAEIAGLKEALEVLSPEASFLERGSSHSSSKRHLRSISLH